MENKTEYEYEVEITDDHNYEVGKIIPMEKWLPWKEALLSGDYKQCSGVLQNSDAGFCCLGVLCDIDPRTEWKSSLDQMACTIDGTTAISCLPHGAFDFVGSDGDFAGFLVKVVEKGKSMVCGQYCGGLAECNDEGLTFAQITEIIEKHMVKKESE